MTKETYYTYLGETGTLTAQIQIPGAFSVKKFFLFADPGKRLTKDDKHFFYNVMIPESEIDLWKEVDYEGQE